MKISVALATWNGAGFVEAQLRSIARQTRPPDELVVSDDGSTDDTVERVETVSGREHLPLRLLRADGRGGVVENFERAIAATTGDIVVLSDQDDVWSANKLAVLERTFQRRPDLGGAFSDGRIVDEHGRPTGRTLWRSFGFSGREQRHAMRPGGMGDVLLRKNVVTGATLAFAGRLRDLVLPIGRHGLHDSWIALLVAAASDLEPIPYPLVDYRIHRTNVEGLGVRRPGAAIAQRTTGRKEREVEQFEALLGRLRERSPQSTGAIAALEQKVEHLRFRCELPSTRLTRARGIIGALPTYRRYSSSWRSPLLDLVAPTTGSAAAGTEHAANGTSEDTDVE